MNVKIRHLSLVLVGLLLSGCMKFYQSKVEQVTEPTACVEHKKFKVEDFQYEYISDSDHDSGLGFGSGFIPLRTVKFNDHACYKSDRMHKYMTDLLESYKVNTRSKDFELIIEGSIPIRQYDRKARYYCLDLPIIFLTLQSYYVQYGKAEVEIRIYRSNREYVKSYRATKKTKYSTIGVPFHTWGAFEYTCFPVALEMATKDCLHHCLNQFLRDYKAGVFK